MENWAVNFANDKQKKQPPQFRTQKFMEPIYISGNEPPKNFRAVYITEMKECDSNYWIVVDRKEQLEDINGMKLLNFLI